MLKMFRAMRTVRRIDATLRHQPICEDCCYPKKFSIRRQDENTNEVEERQAGSLNCALGWVSNVNESRDSPLYAIYDHKGNRVWEGWPSSATDKLNDISEHQTLPMNTCVNRP